MFIIVLNTAVDATGQQQCSLHRLEEVCSRRVVQQYHSATGQSRVSVQRYARNDETAVG